MVRRNILAMSAADEAGLYIFPDDISVNIANPEDLGHLRKIFGGRKIYIAVGSDVVKNASAYKKRPQENSIHSFNHIVFAREAGKQSGRCLVTEIAEPVSLKSLAAAVKLPSANLVPWEEASCFGPLAFRENHPSLSSLGILIGPEGGIEKEEILSLQSAGFIPITLGKRILRTETAGLAAVSAFMSLYGEME